MNRLNLIHILFCGRGNVFFLKTHALAFLSVFLILSCYQQQSWSSTPREDHTNMCQNFLQVPDAIHFKRKLTGGLRQLGIEFEDSIFSEINLEQAPDSTLDIKDFFRLILLEGSMARNKMLSNLAVKYPKLAFYLMDPIGFIKSIEDAAAKQIRQFPSHSLGFDFSMAGLPFIEDAIETIPSKIEEYKTELEQEDKKFSLNKQKYMSELRLGIQFLEEIQERMKLVLERQTITYGETLFLAHAFAQGMDVNEYKKLSWPERTYFALDNSWQGFKKPSVKVEYDRFKKGEFRLMMSEISSVDSIRESRPEYKRGFYDRNDLPYILIPTQVDINERLLLSTIFDKIFLIGIVPRSLWADGVVRPPVAFGNHDHRHSSLIYHRLMYYKSIHSLNTPEELADVRVIGAWLLNELDLELEKLKSDSDLVEVIQFYMFNFHHDRGYPLLSSSYVGSPSYKKFAFGKFLLKFSSNQKMKFTKIENGRSLLIKNPGQFFQEVNRVYHLFKKAQQFVREFMLTTDDSGISRIMLEDLLTGFSEGNIKISEDGLPQNIFRDYKTLSQKVLKERLL